MITQKQCAGDKQAYAAAGEQENSVAIGRLYRGRGGAGAVQTLSAALCMSLRSDEQEEN